MVDITITTLGCLTSQHENGLSYSALDTFRHPVKVMLPPSSMMLCMSLEAVVSTGPTWVI